MYLYTTVVVLEGPRPYHGWSGNIVVMDLVLNRFVYELSTNTVLSYLYTKRGDQDSDNLRFQIKPSPS